MLIGIVGKPSSGKSTFLNAATGSFIAKTADYPFTTIEPNLGKAYVTRKDISLEFNVTPEPKNSLVKDGVRFCPVELLDVAGLVPGAHEGKGMGNKFLNDLSRADVLLHVVDISGSLNEKGEPVEPGTRDPMDDIKFLEEEIAYWLKSILERTDWLKFARTTHMNKTPVVEALVERLSGIGVHETHVVNALKSAGLKSKLITDWSDEEKLNFASALQKEAKPIIIIANKIDKKEGQKNFDKLKQVDDYKDRIFPCSALAEFYLRNYSEKGIINYIPGSGDFKIEKPESLSKKEKNGLLKIKSDLLNIYNSTGVQAALNNAVFKVLDYIFVYPVYDPNKLTDHDGRVLPDVFLVKKNTKLIDFVANKIHTDLAKSFIYGINVKTKRRLSEDYELQSDDVIKIVSAK
ncbi:MAG: redox-regulated ATPase YchF [Promethearchaeota archaeon]